VRDDNVPAPSRLYLPKLDSPPPTILDYLIERFPRMAEETWQDRISRGVVTFEDGTPVAADSRYRHGTTIRYRREVPDEPEPEVEEVILYQDDELLVADKPHGMVVSPTGDHLERSLLVRLQRRTRQADLAPMHRLDRDTAGLVLFSVNPATRGRYHQLFPEGKIEKEYLAIAHLAEAPPDQEWLVENRIVEDEPWYRRRIGEGPVNAITEIQLVDQREGLGLFKIRPRTGKQHQIRVHMASLGFGIAGDPLYPEMRPRPVDDGPLQLLAHRLAFVDPVRGDARNFTSERALRW
jgi:tRNA pseudouridine32 synthase/23S rRNA pseudouridine746 synthase